MTPHIKAEKNDIAKTVIMPGDPIRAKFIAEKYLSDYKLVNEVRNMLAYTGYYKGKKVTIMASGMGIPSMGIYSYELFKFYDVDNIIRVGTSGSYSEKIDVNDIILVTKSISESSYSFIQNGDTNNYEESSNILNDRIFEVSSTNSLNIFKGNIYCSEVFYRENDNYKETALKYDCLGVEMESFALFHNAKVLNKNAACILTVSDSFVSGKSLTSDERETSFTKMIELALESV